jgi:uncharacterized protein YjbI with pentapeptide repeats
MEQKRAVRIDTPVTAEEYQSSKINEDDRYSRHEGCLFQNEACETDYTGHSFHQCRFEHITWSMKAEDMLMADGIFLSCDLSRMGAGQGCFRRSAFQTCRMSGFDGLESIYEDVTFRDCELSYANFSGSKFRRVKFEHCSMKETGFSNCSFSHVLFEDCDLTGAEFLGTPLKSVDLSDDIIDGISVNPYDLRGVIMNERQAAACARMLGVIIKNT